MFAPPVTIAEGVGRGRGLCVNIRNRIGGHQFARFQECVDAFFTASRAEKPFQDRSPVLGTNYLQFEWSVPKTGLRFYEVGP